jgi:glucose-6-phosphate-specific signal transduction histidine kinase
MDDFVVFMFLTFYVFFPAVCLISWWWERKQYKKLSLYLMAIHKMLDERLPR